MSERRLREALAAARVPAEAEAEERAWRVVRAAYDGREPARRRRPPLRLALAAAAVATAAVAVASPPGRAVLDSLREAIGVEHAEPALFSLPAPGRLVLASAAGGAWTAAADGSKRRLGDYLDASWSPFGRFVVAARAHELAALERDGSVRWTLSRPSVRFARWSGTRTDTRIAYLSGRDLRVVAGDGTGDHLLVADVDPVAPAWRPGGGFVVAFARNGGVDAVAAATGERLWTRRVGGVRALAWSADGRRLLVRGARRLVVLDERGRMRFELLRPEAAAAVTAAALSPDGRSLAFVQRAGGRSLLWLVPALRGDGSAARRVFAGAGAFTGLEWSPDGRWLLVAWRDADQWLFLRSAGVRAVRGVSDISRQFGGAFPALGGWCCATGS